MKIARSPYWLTVLALLSLVSVARSQTEPGTYLVGTNVSRLSLGRRDASGRPTSTVLLKPALGRFVRTNLVVGLELPFSYTHVREDPFVGTNTDIGISPFVRYYLGSGETVKPFGSVTAGWRYNHNRLVNRIDQYDDVLTGNDFIYGVTAGVAFFLNQTVSLEVSANYADSASPGNRWDNRLWGLSYSNTEVLTIRFGFQVYLGRDKHSLPCTY